MNIKTFVNCFVFSVISIAPGLANPRIEQAILKKVNEQTKVTAREVKDASVAKCFSGPIYKTEVKYNLNQATYFDKSIYTIKKDDVIEIAVPSTNSEMPELQGIVNPEFKLKTKEDGESLIKAMQALFGSTFKADKVETHFVQNGTTWTLITGTFLKEFSGYTFETNSDGKITKISRALGIKK